MPVGSLAVEPSVSPSGSTATPDSRSHLTLTLEYPASPSRLGTSSPQERFQTKPHQELGASDAALQLVVVRATALLRHAWPCFWACPITPWALRICPAHYPP